MEVYTSDSDPDVYFTDFDSEGSFSDSDSEGSFSDSDSETESSGSEAYFTASSTGGRKRKRQDPNPRQSSKKRKIQAAPEDSLQGAASQKSIFNIIPPCIRKIFQVPINHLANIFHVRKGNKRKEREDSPLETPRKKMKIDLAFPKKLLPRSIFRRVKYRCQKHVLEPMKRFARAVEDRVLSLVVEKMGIFVPAVQRTYIPATCCDPEMKLVRCLGKGGFGLAVLRENTRTSQLLVDKIISTKDQDQEASVIREVDFLQAARGCPQIIQFHSYKMCSKTYAPPNKDHHIVTEYFPSEILGNFLLKYNLTIPGRREILSQLGQGLQFLHSKNIIHADLKTDNILISNNLEVKIIDLGCARWGPHSNNFNGAIVVAAPEERATIEPNLTGERRTYSFTSDYYQLGNLAYEMEYGTAPFMFLYRSVFSGLTEDYKKYILNGLKYIKKKTGRILPIVVRYPYKAEAQYQDLMERLLDPNPDTRLEDDTFFKHPVFTRDNNSLRPSSSGSRQYVQPLSHLAIDALVEWKGQDVSKKILAVKGAKKLDTKAWNYEVDEFNFVLNALELPW